MKPGAIITPKTNDPAKAKFYVRSTTRNGWVRCVALRHLEGPQPWDLPWQPCVFKFRAREMEVVG